MSDDIQRPHDSDNVLKFAKNKSAGDECRNKWIPGTNANGTDYSTLTDEEISLRVGKLISPDGMSIIGASGKVFIHEYGTPVGGYGQMCLGWMEFDPCNLWQDAGPIIAKYGIGLMPFKNELPKAWDLSTGLLGNREYSHENLLRAAMIVFLMKQEAK